MSKEVLKVTRRTKFDDIVGFIRKSGIEPVVNEGQIEKTGCTADIQGEGTIEFYSSNGDDFWAWRKDGLIRRIDCLRLEENGIAIDCVATTFMIDSIAEEDVAEEFTVPAEPCPEAEEEVLPEPDEEEDEEEEAEFEPTHYELLVKEYRDLQDRIIQMAVYLEEHWEDDEIIGNGKKTLYSNQLMAMRQYRYCLAERMKAEGVMYREGYGE